MTPFASIVVPTYRRPELLERCLAALVAQEYPPEHYEIIVVDDAACLDTVRQVACWSGRSQIRIRCLTMAEPARHGPAAARNRGWRCARGAVIAFTDDDCIPDPGWLCAGVAALCGQWAGDRGRETVNSGQHAVHSPQSTIHCPRPVGGWGRTLVPLPPEPTDYERDVAGLERAEAITANAFYRREALEAVGGFDERFRAAWREDSDLFFTLLEQGARVEPIPAAIVVHPVRPGRWGICLSQQRKSSYNALLYKKHPHLYRERIQTTPPWEYYCTLGAAIVALTGLLFGHRRLTLAATVCWAWLTGQFCARRLAGTRHTPRHVVEMLATSALVPLLSIFWRLRGALKYRAIFL